MDLDANVLLLSRKCTFEIGLLIGSSPDCILNAAVTPMDDGAEEISIDWVEHHSMLVNGCLPGGLCVFGVYAVLKKESQLDVNEYAKVLGLEKSCGVVVRDNKLQCFQYSGSKRLKVEYRDCGDLRLMFKRYESSIDLKLLGRLNVNLNKNDEELVQSMVDYKISKIEKLLGRVLNSKVEWYGSNTMDGDGVHDIDGSLQCVCYARDEMDVVKHMRQDAIRSLHSRMELIAEEFSWPVKFPVRHEFDWHGYCVSFYCEEGENGRQVMEAMAQILGIDCSNKDIMYTEKFRKTSDIKIKKQEKMHWGTWICGALVILSILLHFIVGMPSA